MKKIISICCCCLLFAVAVSAQESQGTKAKLKEIPEGWLPQAGDFSIGIDATPLLEYVGNAFSGNTTTNTLDDFGGTAYLFVSNLASVAAPDPQVSIMAKYMLADNLAVRVNVGVLIDAYNVNFYTTDDLKAITSPLEDAKVIDNISLHNTGMSLAFGVERRMGERKIQGIFGASFFSAFNKSIMNYSYGNAITEINQSPSSINYGNINVGNAPYNANDRLLKDASTGLDSYVGLIGHAGIEWFFAPKVSVGGEVNLSLYGSFFTERYQVTEAWNPLVGAVEEWTEVSNPKSSGLHFGTENVGANVFLHFYF